MIFSKNKSINDINENIVHQLSTRIPYLDISKQMLPVKIVNYVDGDTVDLVCVVKLLKYTKTLKLNKYTNVVLKFRCRLYGVDAAERYTQRGQLATKFLKSTCKDKNITAYFYESDKYGRQVAELYINGQSIVPILLDYKDSKYGACFHQYDGKSKRKPFPPEV